MAMTAVGPAGPGGHTGTMRGDQQFGARAGSSSAVADITAQRRFDLRPTRRDPGVRMSMVAMQHGQVITLRRQPPWISNRNNRDRSPAPGTVSVWIAVILRAMASDRADALA